MIIGVAENEEMKQAIRDMRIYATATRATDTPTASSALREEEGGGRRGEMVEEEQSNKRPRLNVGVAAAPEEETKAADWLRNTTGSRVLRRG